jgi:hypothetical protein
LLHLKSVIFNTLKNICLLFRARRYKYKPIILFFLIPCTLYLIPVIIPIPVILPAANAKTVTLGWDSNSEPDLEGYVIYRNAGSPGPPYNYSDTLPEAELADPLHPKATLTGLKEDKEYYIALTAYNTDGVESSFSNDVCVEVVDGIVEPCSASLSPGTPTSSSSGSSGGGSSGGCFISSASDNPASFTQFILKPAIRSQVLALLVLLLILITAVKRGCNKTHRK